MVYQHGRDTVQ